MVKSMLVAGLLVSGLPAHSDTGQPPVPAAQTALSSATYDGDGWKTEALKALDLKIDENGSESERSVALTIDRGALLAKLPML